MKKHYRLNEKGKTLLFMILVFMIVIIGTILYLDRIEKINNGEMKITCNCERDK